MKNWDVSVINSIIGLITAIITLIPAQNRSLEYGDYTSKSLFLFNGFLEEVWAFRLSRHLFGFHFVGTTVHTASSPNVVWIRRY